MSHTHSPLNPEDPAGSGLQLRPRVSGQDPHAAPSTWPTCSCPSETRRQSLLWGWKPAPTSPRAPARPLGGGRSLAAGSAGPTSPGGTASAAQAGWASIMTSGGGPSGPRGFKFTEAALGGPSAPSPQGSLSPTPHALAARSPLLPSPLQEGSLHRHPQADPRPSDSVATSISNSSQQCPHWLGQTPQPGPGSPRPKKRHFHPNHGVPESRDTGQTSAMAQFCWRWVNEQEAPLL